MHALDHTCAVGDLVTLHEQVAPGSSLRVRPRAGVVIAQGASLTVRHLVRGEGVEQTIPLGSPSLVRVEVRRRSKVRRARLTYLRDRGLKLPDLREPSGASAPKPRKRGAKAKAERRARSAARKAAQREDRPPGSAGTLARLRPSDPPFVPPTPRTSGRAFDRG